MNTVKKEAGKNAGEAGADSGTKARIGSVQPLIISSKTDSKRIGDDKALVEQQRKMQENIGKRAAEVKRLAEKMSGKDYKITDNDLESISDANVKLFIEINVYTNMLAGMKDGLGVSPKASREEIKERTAQAEKLDRLIDHMENLGDEANGSISKLAKNTDFVAHELPMSILQITNIQNDMYGTGYGNPQDRLYKRLASKRLGRGVIDFENGEDNTVMQKQMEKYYNGIVNRLSHENRTLLDNYNRSYTDLSELVVGQLAAIGVDFMLLEEGQKVRARREKREELAPLVFVEEKER